MSNGGDAAEQVVRMSLDGVEYVIKIAGTGAKNLAALLMAALKSHKAQPPTLKITGQERLKRMLKSGQPLDVFSVREKDIKGFMTEAKKYGIVYCAIRDKEPKADGMVDVLVRKEDSPKINRVMELLQYGAVDTAAIQSEIAKTRAEQGAEPAAPEQAARQNIDSFLDDIMPGEGKSEQAQNQAVRPPVEQKEEQDFFSDARTKQNPSERGLDSSSNSEKKTADAPASVKDEIRQIRSELKQEAARQKEEPRQSRGAQQTTRHKQPQNTRKPKSKTGKGR